MTDVAIAKKRSKQFVLFWKKARQSGNEMAKRAMISISKIIVARLSVMPRSVEPQTRRTEESLRGRAHRSSPQCLDCKVNGNQSDPNDLRLIVQTLPRRDWAFLHNPFVFCIKHFPSIRASPRRLYCWRLDTKALCWSSSRVT